ncbi:DNA primase large subunit [Dacryopinax primogenitus]|uniref:DNA primase large subunit n=1 Tax=Dacryopinax primogenitus (strain DJM 731) TaxID=1858805 RepID=M5GDI7_DACPD|nr:DNA primase large subunit [Dacryopinax primogenitus]EJU04562.1 DNA primase large subunit [Dacryopinax primogenitus]
MHRSRDTKPIAGLSLPLTKDLGQYPHRLNFYEKPPQGDLTVEDFETFAIDRLRVLAEIESSLIRNRSPEELRLITVAQCAKYLPLSANTSTKDLISERRKDQISHFVLRLAFCRSEELRRRFVKAETTLFRIRFADDDTRERAAFLDSIKLNWEKVDEEERREAHIKAGLQAQAEYLKRDERQREDYLEDTFYKTPWTQVPELVERRRVFLWKGWAYVPSREQSTLVFQEFQNRLEQALEITAKALPRLDEDDRLLPVLEHLSRGFLAGVASEYVGPEDDFGETITADMIDDMAAKHFPMCMRNLHDRLRKDRHLKHFGRLQYTLFLKGLGVSVEEAVVFWRKAYGGTMTDDKFNKEYKYNIRHSYGLEGKRANYPAKSCQTILTTNQPGPTESHGCPFRHFSPENLQLALSATYGIPASDQGEIMAAVKGQHYHIACTRVFELTHVKYGVKMGDGLGRANGATETVSHPNRYAARSREMEKEKSDKGKAAPAVQVAVEENVVMA